MQKLIFLRIQKKISLAALISALLINLIFSVNPCLAQESSLSLISWNLKDFGKSKTDAEIRFVAETVRPYDLIAIQEVVAGYGGPQAVARLADELNRTGQKWDYSLSEVTSGSSSHKKERYAFIWKTAKIKPLGRPWLEQKYGLLIEREPFYGRFKVGRAKYTVVNYHAITKSQQPEREIKFFRLLPECYPDDDLIFCGDFNLPQSHTVFNPLKNKGYRSALTGQKTSLRQRCVGGDCLASEFDNFYFNASKLKLQRAGVLHFYRGFTDIKLARKLSDHIPIFSIYQYIK